MSKSYLGTLSLIMSFLITVCAIFIIPEVISELGFESVEKFITGFIDRIGEFNVLIFTAFVGILVLNIFLKCLNVAICKKLSNAFVFILDIAFIACGILVFLFCPSEIFIFVIMLSILEIIFDFVYFYAQM